MCTCSLDILEDTRSSGGVITSQITLCRNLSGKGGGGGGGGGIFEGGVLAGHLSHYGMYVHVFVPVLSPNTGGDAHKTLTLTVE